MQRAVTGRLQSCGSEKAGVRGMLTISKAQKICSNLNSLEFESKRELVDSARSAVQSGEKRVCDSFREGGVRDGARSGVGPRRSHRQGYR